MTEIEILINEVQKLPLKDALSYLVAKGILDFSSEKFNAIKQFIRDRYNERKYAFVPDAEEAKKLSSISEKSDYKKLAFLIPNYKYLDLLRTGLLIKEYHERDSQKDRERVDKIKHQISQKPNSTHLLKIVNLPTTPFFQIIVSYLFYLKTEKSYSDEQIKESFNEIVSEWEENSLFVTNNHNANDVISFCKTKISQKKQRIFLLGMRSPTKVIESAINSLNKISFFEKNNFELKIVTYSAGNQPRMEVTISKKTESSI